MKTRRLTRSMTTLHQNSLPIPDELVYEIYSRLPLESIARCHCVCKLWSSMLRRQEFTDLFSAKSCARPQILFVCRNDRNKKIMFSSAPQPQYLEGDSYAVAANDLAPLSSTYSSFLGCTNGFFLYYDRRLIERLKGFVNVAVIGNPSTGQSLTLPRLKSGMRDVNLLGYDPIAKEFKVLSMARECVKNVCISVEYQVLTLGTKRLSWRKVQCCIPHLPSRESICIGGVLYYVTVSGTAVSHSMVVCFDLRTDKFSCVNFLGMSSKAKPGSQTLVNYSGKLGLLMSENFTRVYGGSKSIELWVLRDAAKHEWSVHVYMLPPLWKDVVKVSMGIAGMVGTNEIVLSPRNLNLHPYVIYYNVVTKTITNVGVQGIEAFQGKDVHVCLNYAENVKLL